MEEFDKVDSFYCTFIELPSDHTGDADAQQETVGFASLPRSFYDGSRALGAPSITSDMIVKESSFVQSYDVRTETDSNVLHPLLCTFFIHFSVCFRCFLDAEFQSSAVVTDCHNRNCDSETVDQPDRGLSQCDRVVIAKVFLESVRHDSIKLSAPTSTRSVSTQLLLWTDPFPAVKSASADTESSRDRRD